MNLTSRFLLHSDKLAIGPHLLLAPANTVVKPAEHEVAHRLRPILGAVSAMLSAEVVSRSCCRSVEE